jgi:hypothetical protein
MEDVSQTYGPSWPVTGIALLFYIIEKYNGVHFNMTVVRKVVTNGLASHLSRLPTAGAYCPNWSVLLRVIVYLLLVGSTE